MVGGSTPSLSPMRIGRATCFGQTRTDSKLGISSETRFRSGSISKTLTAWLTLRLTHAGLVRLDASVAEVFGVEASARARLDKRITIAMLLEHTSGLPGSTYRDYATQLPQCNRN